MSWENEYSVSWFALLTFRKTRYCWYAVGPWIGHMMDWRGLNQFHGRIPDSPTFANTLEATTWLQKAVSEGKLQKHEVFSGHHAGERFCRKGCDDRETAIVFISNGVLNQQQMKDLITKGE